MLASVVARFAGDRTARRRPDAYEAALAPIYAFAYSVVQDGEAKAVTARRNALAQHLEPLEPRRAPEPARTRARRLADAGRRSGRVNRMGLGPFGPDISGAELRRAGLRAMAEVVSSLGIEAEHVIFGHTHRAGPAAGRAERAGSCPAAPG